MTVASEALSSPSVLVERRFFGIVRWFGLGLTVAALAAAILFGAGGASKLAGSADEHIKRPTAGYPDFQRTVEASSRAQASGNADPTIQRKEQQLARDQAELDFARRLQPHLDAIVASLSAYAAAVDTPKPSAEAVGDYVRQSMKTFVFDKDDGLAWGYVEGMKKAVADLAADGGRLAKLTPGDTRRARWDQFLQWYSSAYREQIAQEERRIAGERAQAAAGKVGAAINFYMAAASFGVFVLATILLVLLRIERNTRREA